MKCILLNSPIYRESTNVNESYLPPIGLGYIATYLNKAGIDVELIDCTYERLGVKEILDILYRKVPAYIGINIFSQNYDIVKYIISSYSLPSKIIIGGQVVKSIYHEIVNWKTPNPLTLVIGEAELIFPDIIKNQCRAQPVYMENNNIVYHVDKNSRYFPSNLSIIKLDRRFLKNNVIINHYGRSEASIITSRGCIYNCAFCGGAHNLNRDVLVRIRNTESIETEINELLTDYPLVTSIRVLDDLFLRNRESIINAIDLFNKFPYIYWRGMAHICSFSKSLDLFSLLKNAKCQELFIGIESGSEKMRKKINKTGTVMEIKDTVEKLLQVGIDVKGYFMYGFPDENLEDFEATYTLASSLKKISASTSGVFRSSVFQFRPYHGTQLYNEIIRKGRSIPSITMNPKISYMPGRSQFNFHSGNYSNVSDKILTDYIVKTQQA